MQIDSIIRTDENGEKKFKYLYEYTDGGQVLAWTSHAWDKTAADWKDEITHSMRYTYDDSSRVIREVYGIFSEKVSYTETTINAYDDKGRICRTDFMTSYNHRTELFHYTEENLCLYTSADTLFWGTENEIIGNDKQERYLNDAGNATMIIYYGYDKWLGEDTQWYPYAEENIEYDAQQRVTHSKYVVTDASGKPNFTEEKTYTYDGPVNIYEKVTTEDGQSTYYAEKEESSGENPVIQTIYEKRARDAEWNILYIEKRYYSGLTANESISGSVEPAFEAYTADGAIVITTTEATAVQVYGMTGVCHYNATVNGTATIANLPAGIYIVTAGGETLKIAVR